MIDVHAHGGPVWLPRTTTGRDKSGQPLNTGEAFDALLLGVGSNMVDPRYWAFCEKNAQVQALIASQRITVGHTDAVQAQRRARAEKQPSQSEGLRELSADEARTFINACDDVTVLSRWLTQESKSKARKAVRDMSSYRMADVRGDEKI